MSKKKFIVSTLKILCRYPKRELSIQTQLALDDLLGRFA